MLSDKETTDDENDNPTDTAKKLHPSSKHSRWWASATTEGEDSEETDASVGAREMRRLDSQQSSSVSFRSDLSESEQSDAVSNRKRQKSFSVRLKTSQGDFAVSVNASSTQMFIENVKTKFHSKCQGRNIDSLSLEIDKDDCISLEEDAVEFKFLKSLRIITVKIESSPKVNPVKHTVTGTSVTVVKDFGK